MKKNILVINGSPQGAKGNCAVMISSFKKKYKNFDFKVLHLAQNTDLKTQLDLLKKADAFLFTTGTYWDSWGSPLQAWLEQMTPYEGSAYFMNKPAGVVVLMHSVGGKGVLSRLQGVLNTFGCLNPPMSGVVYSLVSDLVKKVKNSHAEDFWSLDDIGVVLENLAVYTDFKSPVRGWPVDKKSAARKWLRP